MSSSELPGFAEQINGELLREVLARSIVLGASCSQSQALLR
jgi:hypothetical protein